MSTTKAELFAQLDALGLDDEAKEGAFQALLAKGSVVDDADLGAFSDAELDEAVAAFSDTADEGDPLNKGGQADGDDEPFAFAADDFLVDEGWDGDEDVAAEAAALIRQGFTEAAEPLRKSLQAAREQDQKLGVAILKSFRQIAAQNAALLKLAKGQDARIAGLEEALGQPVGPRSVSGDFEAEDRPGERGRATGPDVAVLLQKGNAALSNRASGISDLDRIELANDLAQLDEGLPEMSAQAFVAKHSTRLGL